MQRKAGSQALPAPRILLFPTLVVLYAVAFPAIAHQGASGVVKERMDAMQSVAQSMKRINRQLKAGAEFDRGEIAREASSIAEHSRVFATKFPTGTGGGVSEAKPEIWQNQKDFAAKSDALTTAARLLSEAAGKESLSELNSRFRAVGKTCSACHRDYRQKKSRH